MSVTLVPPPPRISLVDERGNITRPWSLYFQDVFGRLGGAVAPSNDELATMIDDQFAPAPFPPAPPTDDLAPTALVMQAADAPSGRLEALEAAVFALRQQVEALTQGVAP